MATNPRLPNQPSTTNQKRPQLVPGQETSKRPGSGVPGVLFAIVVAAALITAVVYYMPRAPKKSPAPTAAEVPVQPVANQLEFSNLKLTVAPTGGALDLDGMVMNTGNRPVLGATVQLTFQNASGAALDRVTRPLVGKVDKDQALRTDNFSTDPLKPNATRAFRVSVSPLPAGWNHTMPEMKVLTVASEGNR